MAIPAAGAGSPAITFEWYRAFIQTLLDNNAYTWFAPLIVFGEMAVGLGLLLGVLTGFAAFFGALMNMSFLLAGSASVNPVLFTLAVGLILGLEGRRLLRRRPLPAPDARHPVASGRDQGQGHHTRRRRRLTHRPPPRAPARFERNLRPRSARDRGARFILDRAGGQRGTRPSRLCAHRHRRGGSRTRLLRRGGARSRRGAHARRARSDLARRG